ncbi:MAG: S1C family serine protease [Lachnospiraceae bacterium]|nr:S1C family serine protease [Lachnospiraceae bacterium]
MGIFKKSDKGKRSVFDISDSNYNAADSYGFIKEEQLPQNRSIRRRKTLMLGLTVVLSAVLFGVLASVVFRITSGVLDRWDSGKHEVDLGPTGSVTPGTPGETDVKIDPTAFAEIEKMYEGIRSTARAFNSSIVEVSAITYTSDPIFGKRTAEGRSFYGIILAENGSEYLIMVRNGELDGKYDELTVTFYNGVDAAGRIVQRNSEVNLAVVAVSLKSIVEVDRRGIKPVTIGNSAQTTMGSAVIAVGCINGTSRSVDFGFVNSDSISVYIRDNALELVQTNMVLHKGAFGLLINASGEAVGIVTEDFNDSNCLCAITTNSIKAMLNDMLNDRKMPVFGAYCMELPSSVRKSMSIKGGIRIDEIVDGSPADEAGFRKGDIILRVQDDDVYYVSQFNTLMRREASSGKMRVTYLRGSEEATVDVPIVRE